MVTLQLAVGSASLASVFAGSWGRPRSKANVSVFPSQLVLLFAAAEGSSARASAPAASTARRDALVSRKAPLWKGNSREEKRSENQEAIGGERRRGAGATAAAPCVHWAALTRCIILANDLSDQIVQSTQPQILDQLHPLSFAPLH